MSARLTAIAVLALVILPLYCIYKPPGLVISWLQRQFPEVLFQVSTTQKVVALTIDDAPTQYTEQILEILKDNGAAATFFSIGGQVAGREDVLQSILRSGSELGNHAMHDEPSINLPSQTLKEEITQVNEYIDAAYRAAGRPRQAHYFRPGSGIFSSRLVDLAKDMGYRTILGGIYPHDPFVSLWRLNAWHILGSLRPGAIIICHDRRPWTLPMLKRVVPEIKRRGYEIVTVTGLLESTRDT
ncbi:hypothetical protein BDY17DRAFT_308665 [Neohortaea acidophila]|uniref:chitin deacetylase n=1 Tax=Neohortaea acidophila TaxID=245834 RepID=A0A6A6PZN0_9PEZI|nr:uncharacterized protein BDY17DRAFT_308665 [Neohortaea acidophila]KAF2485231.1 hypothetical protein BDY17DRAFT_308665 [Neohortaea acidophila]